MSIAAKPPARRGYTLLEMTIVIFLVSILLFLIGYPIEVALRAERTLQQRAEHEANIARLAARFRADVRGGTIEPAKPRGVEAAEGELEFRITRRSAPALRYSATDKGVVTRTVEWPEGKIEHDSFELPAGTRLRLELGEQLATLWIDQPRGLAGEEPIRWHSTSVIAARGADERMWNEQGLQPSP